MGEQLDLFVNRGSSEALPSSPPPGAWVLEFLSPKGGWVDVGSFPTQLDAMRDKREMLRVRSDLDDRLRVRKQAA